MKNKTKQNKRTEPKPQLGAFDPSKSSRSRNLDSSPTARVIKRYWPRQFALGYYYRTEKCFALDNGLYSCCFARFEPSDDVRSPAWSINTLKNNVSFFLQLVSNFGSLTKGNKPFSYVKWADIFIGLKRRHLSLTWRTDFSINFPVTVLKGFSIYIKFRSPRTLRAHSKARQSSSI